MYEMTAQIHRRLHERGLKVGSDEFERAFDLFTDDPVVFKKLIYEMRFDEASAWYAEFGPFYVGLQFSPSELPRYLEGDVPALRP
jgi:hydrogen peroxide-dependent heme synthase